MAFRNDAEILYQGLTGIQYQIENTYFAKGGEGSLYYVQNNSKIVAKIYKAEKRDQECEKKLQYMVQQKLTDEQLEDVAWPQDVLYDQNGFAGYIMPKIEKAQSLTALYSDKEYDLRYRLGAAINLCKAIETVHEIGQVCGDLNPQNICINLDKMDRDNGFRVALVDVDSYHIVTADRIFRCEVGLADYLAPEIQRKVSNGLTLKNAPLPTYTRETDLFALAVHIFSLLMNGSHPFACAKSVSGTVSDNMQQMTPNYMRNSVVAPQPIENIKEGIFPFYEKRAGITIPLYAPEFSSLPPAIQQLFIRTFVDGDKEPSKRVPADEWEKVLRQTVNNTVECSKGHYYFNHGLECPICKIERQIIDIIGIKNIPLVPQQIIEENGLSARSSFQSARIFSIIEKIPPRLIKRERNNGMIFLKIVSAVLIILFIIISIVSVCVTLENVVQSEYPEMYSDFQEYYETEGSSEVWVTLKLVDAGGYDYKLSEDGSWKLYYEQNNEVGEDSEYCYFFSDESAANSRFLSVGQYSAMLIGESYDEDEDDFVVYTSFDVPSTSTDKLDGTEAVAINVVIN